MCASSPTKIELARSLIKRKLEAERRVKAVTAKRAATIKTRESLESSIAENQGHLTNIRQKLELLVNEAQTTQVPGSVAGEIDRGNDEIEIAFLKEKQRRINL